MQEMCRLWEGDNSRLHRCPGVSLRPTRPLHGVRFRMELADGVEDSAVNQTWNSILHRQQTGPGQGEAGLKTVGERNSFIQLIHTSGPSGVPGTVLDSRDTTVTRHSPALQGLGRWTLTQLQKGGGRRGKCHNPGQRMRRRRRRC